jgi:peptidyl-prolyl cis-trans isomerase C
MIGQGRERRWVRRAVALPAVQFAIIGGVLFASERWWPAWSPRPAAIERAPIVVSSADVARWRRDWMLRTGAAPTAAEEAALLDDAVDDEVLLREAVARGFDRDDRVVRARLVKLGRYLGLGTGADDAGIEREARALAFDRSDVAVRRHLIEMMRLAASKPARADLPREADLQAYYAEHVEQFTAPARVRLTHVYLSRTRRGAALEGDAARVLDALRQGGVSPRDVAALGDPFIRGAVLPPATAQQLGQIFGAGFAAALAELPLRTWAGPVPSSYGLHLVWIDERQPATALPLAAVRNQVLHALLRARGEQRLRSNLRALRTHYPVRIEPAASAATGVSG